MKVTPERKAKLVEMLKLPDGRGGVAEIPENDPALRRMNKMSSSELRELAKSMREADYSFDDNSRGSGGPRGRAARGLWIQAAAVDVANAVARAAAMQRLTVPFPRFVSAAAGVAIPTHSMFGDARTAISRGRSRFQALGFLADTMAAARERAEQSPGYTPGGPSNGSSANYGSTHYSDSRDDPTSPSHIPTNLLRPQRAMPEQPYVPLPDLQRAMPEAPLPSAVAPQGNAAPATGDRPDPRGAMNEDEFRPGTGRVRQRPYDKLSAVDLIRALR
jgi:hypothetical protein